MKYKTVFISDVHLGTRSCKARELSNFLDELTVENLYLVGDIIDFWNLNSINKYWDKHHTEVLQKILKKAKKGTNIYYIIGNHDEFIRKFIPFDIENIHFDNKFSYQNIYGKFLVIHGDMFDSLLHTQKNMYLLGSILYDWLVLLNKYYNIIRKWFGKPYWSLSMYLKLQAKEAVGLIHKFENLLLDYAIHHKYVGVIAGHIHKPEVNKDTLYMNTGDWVENMSYLYEDEYGFIKLGYWRD